MRERIHTADKNKLLTKFLYVICFYQGFAELYGLLGSQNPTSDQIANYFNKVNVICDATQPQILQTTSEILMLTYCSYVFHLGYFMGKAVCVTQW